MSHSAHPSSELLHLYRLYSQIPFEEKFSTKTSIRGPRQISKSVPTTLPSGTAVLFPLRCPLDSTFVHSLSPFSVAALFKWIFWQQMQVWVKDTQSCYYSLQPHRLYSPWNSPGQNTEVGSLSLLQGIFPTQGLNPGLPHCRQILYQLSPKGSPRILEWVAYPFSSRSSQPNSQGIEPGSPALQAYSLPTELWGKPKYNKDIT